MIGALIGSLIPFRTDGIDFALTALFIVILLEQLKAAGGKAEPAVIAAVSSLICLLLVWTFQLYSALPADYCFSSDLTEA